jgi:heptosyltransferase-2
LCGECPNYNPWKGFILIIKTAAMGDVLRTTSLLPALREKYTDHKISWLAGAKSEPLLRGNPRIDEIIIADGRELPALLPRLFDLIISLEKTAPEAGLATVLKAKVKLGVGLSGSGAPVPLNPESEYYFSLGLSDDLKFRQNKKTYGEMIFDVCGLPGSFQAPPGIYLAAKEAEVAKKHLKDAGASFDGRRIGLVIGAGTAFANKTPSTGKWASIIRRLAGVLPKSDRLLLLGGPEDADKLRAVEEAAGGAAALVPPLDNVRAFAAVAGFMHAVVCGDTLAAHIAAALRVPAVILFGSTCRQEIDAFGIAVKIVSPAECSPCYKSECEKEPDCMDAILEDKIAGAVRGILDGAGANLEL